MLRLIQKVLFGEPGEISEDQKKLRFPIADAVATAPLLILLIVFGVHPQPITSTLDYTSAAEDDRAALEAAIEAASQPAAVAEMSKQFSPEPVSADTAAVEAKAVTKAEEKAVAETATAEQEVKQVEAEDVR
jgi:NADH-quinone oxidoreductase subunit M